MSVQEHEPVIGTQCPMGLSPSSGLVWAQENPSGQSAGPLQGGTQRDEPSSISTHHAVLPVQSSVVSHEAQSSYSSSRQRKVRSVPAASPRQLNPRGQEMSHVCVHKKPSDVSMQYPELHSSLPPQSQSNPPGHTSGPPVSVSGTWESGATLSALSEGVLSAGDVLST
jgi:hypothetical protein